MVVHQAGLHNRGVSKDPGNIYKNEKLLAGNPPSQSPFAVHASGYMECALLHQTLLSGRAHVHHAGCTTLGY
jgi:hypothetical protein